MKKGAFPLDDEKHAVVMQVGPSGRLYNAEGGREIWRSVEKAVDVASSLVGMYPTREYYVWVPVFKVSAPKHPAIVVSVDTVYGE